MSVDLTVTDVKQWHYCRRIVFYQKLMPLVPPRTYKMKRAREAQVPEERLERRRTLRSFQLPEGNKRFGVRLHSKRWNLTGSLDLLIETGDALYPVDYKETTGPPRENHRWQLAAYALLLREVDGRRVNSGYIRTLPQGDVWPMELPDDLLAQVEGELDAMRQMVEREEFPPPTAVRARCEECEYRNYCGDVFW